MSVFKKIVQAFKRNKKRQSLKKGETDEQVVGNLLSELIKKMHLDLSFSFQKKKEKLIVELEGRDKSLLFQKEGKLLSALQLFLKRVLQHRGFEFKDQVFLDSENFTKKLDQDLLELVKKLKGIAISKKAPVYLKALPPRDRKLVHQHISEDERVKSTSIGEGVYKRVKIFPAMGMKKTEKRRDKKMELGTEHFL